jgi:hypothetical protein
LGDGGGGLSTLARRPVRIGWVPQGDKSTAKSRLSSPLRKANPWLVAGLYNSFSLTERDNCCHYQWALVLFGLVLKVSV